MNEMNTTIRNWVADGCPPTALYREGSFYYTSAHPNGLGGCKVVDLRFDEWGDHTPRSEEDADWIAESIRLTENDNSVEERAQEIQQLGKWLMSQDADKIEEMVDDIGLFIPPPIQQEDTTE